MTSSLPRVAIPRFTGDLLAPGDRDYDAARRVESDAVDRSPALIARCACVADVAAAVRHGRAAGLPITVRGGGHGPDGFAVADGALMLDLRGLDAIAADPASRTARAAGGTTWRALDAATQAHGLGVTGARMPSVGVAGFTLGSGSGWLERKLGLAADSLRAARVVTAAGDVVTASAGEHPDLFWALRGGGSSFGVVVELEFDLHPVGPRIEGGIIGWPLERAAEVAATYAAVMGDAPDDLGGGLALLNALPLPVVPEALHGRPIVAVLVAWTGAPGGADALLAPLRASAPAFDAVGPMPYAALQGMFESPERFTARVHGEGGFLRALTPETVAVLADRHVRKPAPLGSLLMQPLGGAFARMPAGATPLDRRGAPWAWQAGAAWFDPAADDAVAEWAADLRASLAPWSGGESFPNFVPDRDPRRLRAAYGDEVWARLQAIRADWDPDDVLSAGNAIALPR
jgi:FAD/FMN-containing dehydrogenase